MDYSRPVAADYNNVRSLNAAFLSLLRSSAAGAPWRRLLPATVREQITAITDLQLERLAGCPFLLVSFRENEQDHWRALAGDEPAGDLLHEPPSMAQERLVASGLAFLWQLAQRSPYAVRLVSGASSAFCDQLAELTIVRLLGRAAGRSDMAVPRFAGEPSAWAKLLGPGISPTPRLRSAAQLSVLQGLLTAAVAEPGGRLRAAACASPLPVSRIAGKRKRH